MLLRIGARIRISNRIIWKPEASNVPVGAIATGKEVDFSWMLLGIRQFPGHKKLLVTGIGTTLFWLQKNG